MSDDAVRSFLDQQAAIALPAKFADAVTRRNIRDIEACFAPGATWRVPPPMNIDVVGRANVLDVFTRRWPTREFIVQVIPQTLLLDFTGDTASLRSSIVEFGKFDDTEGILIIGFYLDQLVKDGESWVFAERVLRPLYVDRRPVGGEVLAEYGLEGLLM